MNVVSQKELATLAKKFRMAAGKTRADAARDMGVRQPSIFHAEETPGKGYWSLRIKLIEAYSPFTVNGPFYQLKRR